MRFRFSGTLMRFVEFEREQTFDAPTIAAGLEMLVTKHPPLRAVLFSGTGAVRQTHRLFLNGNQIMTDELGTAVGDHDVVEILTAIAGG